MRERLNSGNPQAGPSDVDLPDPFARTGLQVLRGAGLRVGELLDLPQGR
jgi:hypothetical protein